MDIIIEKKFNRVVAKNNFKFDNKDEAVNALIKSLLSETGMIVTNDKKKAKEIVNPDETLETIREIVAEGYLFLRDESAISLRLIQYSAFGIARFVYVVQAVNC